MEQETGKYTDQKVELDGRIGNRIKEQTESFLWLEDAVIYDILPDRFASSWKKLDYIREDNEEESGENKTYGGTIQGIIENMDYLLKLGINCISLNPFIKEGSEMPQASLGDHIHPKLGTDKDFAFLVGLAHNCNFRVILKGFELHLRSFLKGSLKEPEILSDEDTMELSKQCNHWLTDYKMDGILIDKDNISDVFFKELCSLISSISPDCVVLINDLTGKEEGNTNQLFEGSIDNGFHWNIRDFFGHNKLDAYEFAQNSKNHIEKEECKCYTIRYMNSKDTSRFLCDCEEKPERYYLAILYWMTSPGIPLLLYGDEQQACCASEQGNLPQMEWDEESDLFHFIKAAIFVRKKLSSLRHGKYRVISAERGSSLFVYERYSPEDCITIILNAGSREEELESSIGKKTVIWQFGLMENKLEPYGFAMLREKLVQE